MSYRILAGDCVARMGMMKASSIDNCITDPPYEIGFMGKGWDNTGVAYNPRTWRAVHRVLKTDGFLVVFAATRTQHRIAHAIERAGFEIVDIVSWCYGTGFPKSHNISKAIDKIGGNSKMLNEMAQMLEKCRLKRGMTAKECDDIFCGGSTNWSWISGKRDRITLPSQEQMDLISKEWTEMIPIFDSLYSKGLKLGKIIHSRAGGKDFAKQVGSKSQSREETVFASATELAKQWDGWGTALKPAYEPIIIARKKGSKVSCDYQQFHYIPKANKKEKNAGLEETNQHPTVKPIALMKALIENFTEEETTVFDPFTGSGSTGIASLLLNRKFIGCELTPEYIPLTKARLEYAINDGEAFR